MVQRSPAQLPELTELLRLTEALSAHARTRVLARVSVGDASLPILSITLGSAEPSAPSLAFVGGVHGLERIGTQVVLAYLHTLSVRLSWDRVLHDLLSRVRLLFVPLVNPGGMLLGTFLGIFFIPLFFVVVQRLFSRSRNRAPQEASDERARA